MTRLARTHVLVAENVGLTAASGAYSYPTNFVDWASMYDELTWTVSISAVTGSPSAWSFGCKFQYRQMHAGTAYRFQTPRFYDLADEQVGAHIVEGVGWYGPGQPDNGGGFGVIATQASSLASPIVVTRTLQHFPRGVKLVPQLSFTGGTSPVLKVGIEVTGKSR